MPNMKKPKDKTGANRQAKFHENRLKAGLVKIHRYVHPDDIAPIDALISERKAARKANEQQ